MAKGGSRAHAGKKPKPTAMKVVQGTFRPDRHGDEVQVECKWPDPPEFMPLTERQRALWAGLKDRDTWHAESDWPSVLGMVKALDELIQNHEAQQETDTSGHPLAFIHVIKHTVDGSGNAVEQETVTAEENPLKTSEMKWLDRLYKFIAINGYSPVDRAKMPAAGEIKPANPLERFTHRVRA